MPGRIFQDSVTDPTGRYAEKPSAAGPVDTSLGDFLTTVAPAAREIQSGYRLEGYTQEVGPILASGEEIAAEKTALENVYGSTLDTYLNTKDKKSLEELNKQLSSLEEKKARLGPRAVEAQTRMDSITRDFITANPHLAQDAKARAHGSTLERLANTEITIQTAKEKQLELDSQKYGFVGPNRGRLTIEMNSIKTQQELLDMQQKNTKFSWEGNDRMNALQVDKNTLQHIGVVTGILDTLAGLPGGMDTLDPKQKEGLLRLAKNTYANAPNIVAQGTSPGALLPNKEKSVAELQNSMTYAIEVLNGGMSAKEAAIAIKLGKDTDTLRAKQGPEGGRIRAYEQLQRLTEGTSGDLFEKGDKTSILEALKQTFAIQSNGKYPTLPVQEGRGVDPEAAKTAQYLHAGAVPDVLRSLGSGDKPIYLHSNVYKLLDEYKTNPKAVDERAVYNTLKNLGNPEVGNTVRGLNSTERRNYSTTIDAAWETLKKTKILPEFNKDMDSTIKDVPGYKVRDLIKYDAGEYGGIVFTPTNKVEGLSVDQVALIQERTQSLNKTYGPSYWGQALEGQMRFDVLRSQVDSKVVTYKNRAEHTKLKFPELFPTGAPPK